MLVCACFPGCPGSSSSFYLIYDEMFEIFSGCTGSQPDIYTFATDTGYLPMIYHEYYDGVLTPYIVTSPSIYVEAPLGHISYDYSCGEPHGFLFYSNAIGADSIVWDFGDGFVVDTGNVQNILHNYVDSGDYVVKLEMYNYTSGCILTDSIEVYVRNIGADFADITLVCAFDTIFLDAGSSEGVFTPCNFGYEWDFGDMSPVISTGFAETYHIYTQGGTYFVELTVKDINGCIQHHTDTIEVFDINANLNVDPLLVCVPDSVFFTDLSWADTTIVSWSFNSGLGNPMTYVPPSQFYESNVNMSLPISLTIVDILGCMDTWDGVLNLSVLEPVVTASNYDLCPGDLTDIWVNSGYYPVMWYVEDTISYIGNSFSHQFNNPGLYDVVVVLDNYHGCHDSIVFQDFINVHPFPDVYITSDPPEDTLCLPVQITFTDSSIVDMFGSREWDFYNSATINPDPSVTWPYELPGTYQVSLTVESLFGCIDSTVKVFDVQGPLADFELFPPIICQGEEITLELIDTSNVVGWMWDFGDGNVDSTQTGLLSHTYLPNFYPAGGQTFVSLIYWSANCEVTKSQYIDFYPQVIADFSVSANDSVVCLGDAFILSNTSINGITWVWDMGDGTLYNNIQQVNHTYQSTGVYQVELQVFGANSCEDVITHEVLVTDINAEIIASPQLVCESGLVFFTDNSYADAGIADILFNFGDGSLVDSFATSYYYNLPPPGSSYQVQYYIVDSLGCSSSFNLDIQYSNPDASFTPSEYQLCEEEIIDFLPTNSFASYTWDFGDGNISTDANPSISYMQNGSYIVSLVAVDLLGCADTVTLNMPIVVHDNPVASFTYTPNTLGACVNTEFSFVNTSTCVDQSNIEWTIFPDVYTTGTISILWSSIGMYDVNLVVTSIYGCTDEIEESFSIEGPSGELQILEDVICINTNANLVLNNPVDVVSWIWDFGDGVIDASSLSLNTLHEYGASVLDNGMFYIDLIISSGNCTDTLTDSIFVANPIADFTPLDYSCILDFVNFENLSTGSNEWIWVFGDGSGNSTSSDPTHQYVSPGVITVALTASYDGLANCSDTYTSTIQILDPQLDMFFASNPICRGSNEPFQITANSDVSNWSVTFYDGANVLTGTGPYSGTFTFPNNIDEIVNGVTVLVEYSSINGNCSTTLEVPVTFYDVVADFISTDNPNFVICKGESINLMDVSTNADIITWALGDGTTSIDANVTHVYPIPGDYVITLNIYNNTNTCQDSKTDTLYVRDDAIVVTPNATICEGVSYTMNVSAEGGIDYYYWTPEEQFSNPYASNPVVNIISSQSFYVDVIDGFGCPGTGVQTINVINDPPSINWDTTIIIGQSVHLDAWYGDNIIYTWSPDETLDAYDVYDPWAFTLDDNTYVVNLYDNLTYCFDINNTYKIIVIPETTIDMPTMFTPNGDLINDEFIVQGWGIMEVEELKVYNRWGELVFEGFDIETGWDGTYKGKDQPNDTYIYVAKVRTWLDQTLEKRGYINLIR